MTIGTAVEAGLVATVVMTALMYAGFAMGMRLDMLRIIGLMFVGPENPAIVYAVGGMVHLMMGVAFGIVHVGILEAFGLTGSAAAWGALIGLMHGLVVGMAMGMLPAVHPRMGTAGVLAAPGPFARNYGAMLPAGLVALHIVFGVTVGLVYG
jgi:hypothetical protein